MLEKIDLLFKVAHPIRVPIILIGIDYAPDRWKAAVIFFGDLSHRQFMYLMLIDYVDSCLMGQKTNFFGSLRIQIISNTFRFFQTNLIFFLLMNAFAGSRNLEWPLPHGSRWHQICSTSCNIQDLNLLSANLIQSNQSHILFKYFW